jgi:hypothetical protein
MLTLKRLTCAIAVLVCGVIAVPARANQPCFSCGPLQVDALFLLRFDVRWGGGQQHLGPWYAYFPAEAQAPLQQAQHGAAPRWGVQLPLTGPGPLVPAPAPTYSYGNFGIPPSYWYGGP